jgi:hypothetical protein
MSQGGIQGEGMVDIEKVTRASIGESAILQ